MTAAGAVERPGIRRLRVLSAVAAGAMVLVGCTSTAPEAADPAKASLVEQHQLAGLDARQVIDQLDAMPVAERPDDLWASVEPGQLVLSDPTGERAETVLAMPAEEFYLSVAPYETRTHDCYFHSLTTCLGEMSGEPVQVTVTDDATGATIVDETRATYDNGFVGLWLPRDLEGTLTITRGDTSASSPVSTGDDDLTCLTTMQLT
ncbi:CueP family metal-binding protein [Dietzia sp. PP-33]|uniref:CueP family metal-binding protein n=1 Tax=Dietzia sp. PP-33 TaxID=2957500 RepID=UPI0029BF355D|nr:CueP family metal-binding protein [Dietzia sp. PP-33]MDX2358379.1 CueP family metal-binding protein [Dietzia sp. PP-33]